MSLKRTSPQLSSKKSAAPAAIINDEADSLLGKIIVRYGAITVALAVVAPFLMLFANNPLSPWFHFHRILDYASVVVVLIPFYVGISKLYAARLEIGRDLVAKREWKQAVAALEPFNSPTQRFLDGTGEAHYLIVQAYTGVGANEKAIKARNFVLNHRKGVWAEKLQSDSVKVGISKLPKPGRTIITRGTEEKPLRPANTRRRRRF